MADHTVNDCITKEGAAQDKNPKSRGVQDKIVKAISLPFEVTQGLLSNWAAAYSPTVLLGLDETSGTTAEDSSGNGHDGTYSGTYTLGEPGLYTKDKEGVDFADNTISYVDLTPYPAIGPDHSITVIHRPDFIFSFTYMFDSDGAGGGRVALATKSGGGSTGMGYIYGVKIVPSAYKIGEGSEAMWSLRLDSVNDEGTVFMNGLPFFNGAYASDITTGTTKTNLGINHEGSGGESSGLYSLFMHCDSVLSNADFYQQWLDVTDGQEHYFKETIIDDLGLATLGTAGSVVCHLPLWETAGAQAVDVSMNENHADFIGGPTLGADPVVSGFVSSVTMGNGESIEQTGAVDVATSSVTMAGAIRHPAGEDMQSRSTEAVAGIFNSDPNAGRFWVFIPSGGGVGAQMRDGTTSITFTDGALNAGQTWAYCLRYDAVANTLALWVDGSKIGEVDVSSLSLPQTDHFVLGENGIYDTADGDHQHLVTTSAALSDADCLALSNPTFV